jgi:hypothetical protein
VVAQDRTRDKDPCVAKPERQPTELPDNTMSPEVMTLLAMLALDSLLWAWQRRKVRLAAHMYRMRREFVIALDSEGGVKALIGRSVPRWLKSPAGSTARR